MPEAGCVYRKYRVRILMSQERLSRVSAKAFFVLLQNPAYYKCKNINKNTNKERSQNYDKQFSKFKNRRKAAEKISRGMQGQADSDGRYYGAAGGGLVELSAMLTISVVYMSTGIPEVRWPLYMVLIHV